MPLEQGVQSWDHYAYMSNNPLRYTDPTGHRNCEEDGYHCPGWAITPGQLVTEYRERYGKEIGVGFDSEEEELSTRIEQYMSTHPNYDPREDPYLDPKDGDNYRNVTIYRDMRENYWRHRCSCINGGEISLLEQYYDLHEPVTITYWSPENVDWTITSLDFISFVASFFGLNTVSEGFDATQKTVITVGNITTGISTLDSISNGDTSGVLLSGAGMIPGPPGVFFNGVSVARDLSSGFYNTPWVPTLPR